MGIFIIRFIPRCRWILNTRGTRRHSISEADSVLGCLWIVWWRTASCRCITTTSNSTWCWNIPLSIWMQKKYFIKWGKSGILSSKNLNARLTKKPIQNTVENDITHRILLQSGWIQRKKSLFDFLARDQTVFKNEADKIFKKQQETSWSTIQRIEWKTYKFSTWPADQVNDGSQNTNKIISKSWETKTIKRTKQKYTHC